MQLTDVYSYVLSILEGGVKRSVEYNQQIKKSNNLRLQ